MGFGRIRFVDVNKEKATVSISGLTDMTQVDTLATTIKAKSHASLVSINFGYGINETILPTAAQPYGSVEQKAVLKFRNLDIPERDRQIVKMELPAPKAAIFESKMHLGWRVRQSIGDSIASALSTATNGNYVFESGWLKSRRKRLAV